MSNIQALGTTAPLQQAQSVAKSSPSVASSAAAKPSLSDRLELSGMSGLLQSLKTGGDFRADKVASIKAQIESGSYETNDKLDGATDRLLSALGD